MENNNSALMNDMTFVSQNSGALLGAGTHTCRIHSISPSTPKSPGFTDPTPQLKTVFKTPDGKMFTEWYNTLGYMRFEELSPEDKKSGRFGTIDGFAIDKNTGKRMIDEDRTKAARGIFGKLALDAGIPLGTSFKPSDLIDREVVIVIGEDDRKKLIVKGTRPVVQTESVD